MAKVGRNETCPCGSGKKFKKCHGSMETLDMIAQVQREAPLRLAQVQASEARRQSQQGWGKPIISQEMNGWRFIAVNNKLHYSQNWKTFHDFLFDYVKMVMGKDWWMREVAKQPEERHLILQWAVAAHELGKPFKSGDGAVSSVPFFGAASALLGLSYDLYALAHHHTLQEVLVNRLKNADNFAGARYEVAVAAKLLRAGFELEFEDETDGSTTHVEFTATHKGSGKKFSVEAKQRDAEKLRIGRLLHRALSKKAAHPRIVFIDINEPDGSKVAEAPPFMLSAEKRLAEYERNPSSAGLSPAYVIVTNTPWHHHLAEGRIRISALFHAFRIPELGPGYRFRSFREAVETRKAHQDLFDLRKSIEEHLDVPSTFDGEHPEYAFGVEKARLVVGRRLQIADDQGEAVEGILESGVVLEAKQQAGCVLRKDDGTNVLVHISLTEQEMAAWRAHPATFFGVIDRNAGRRPMKTALDWYDFFYETYKKSTKDDLIAWMSGRLPRETLETMGQDDLARLYCEGMAARTYADQVKSEARATE